MNTLSRKSRIAPRWRYQTSGILWRILVDESGILIGEKRHQEEKRASFFAVRECDGKELWSNLSLQEPWWVGMETVDRGILYLHSYEQPNLPTHRGIWAVNSETGSLLWHQPEASFLFVHGEKVYAHAMRFDRRIFIAIDRVTGDVPDQAEIDQPTMQRAREEAIARNSREVCTLPILYDESHAPKEVVRIVRSVVPASDTIAAGEYVRTDTLLLLSYYAAPANSPSEQPRFKNNLVIVNRRSGTRVFQAVLEKEAMAPLPDTFFVRGESVYFVEERQQLVAVHLSGPEES